jgi:DNA-binding beta-propeller fold protein YncE
VLPRTGELAVAGPYNHKISIFDGESGKFLRFFGSEGTTAQTGSLHFQFPTACISDADGNILVLDYSTSRLQAFSPEGEHV